MMIAQILTQILHLQDQRIDQKMILEFQDQRSNQIKELLVRFQKLKRKYLNLYFLINQLIQNNLM